MKQIGLSYEVLDKEDSIHHSLQMDEQPIGRHERMSYIEKFEWEQIQVIKKRNQEANNEFK